MSLYECACVHVPVCIVYLCTKCVMLHTILILYQTEAPQVRNLTAQIVDSTMANISWQQDADACNKTTTPLLYIDNSDSMQSVEADHDCKQMQQPHFECLILGLLPDTLYILHVYITTEDGRRSATAASVSFKTGVR